MSESARIPPGRPNEIGRINFLIARLLGIAVGAGPPAVFTTLARHHGFRRWLWFAGSLMPGGALPRSESELLILRVAHNCGSEYEWTQHERIALSAGLSVTDVARVRQGPSAEGWPERRRLLLTAADELHADRVISDSVWSGLRPLYSDTELIELCLLVGHYEMLAMTLNSLRVAPDPLPAGPPPALARIVEVLSNWRARRAESTTGAG